MKTIRLSRVAVIVAVVASVAGCGALSRSNAGAPPVIVPEAQVTIAPVTTHDAVTTTITKNGKTYTSVKDRVVTIAPATVVRTAPAVTVLKTNVVTVTGASAPVQPVPPVTVKETGTTVTKTETATTTVTEIEEVFVTVTAPPPAP